MNYIYWFERLLADKLFGVSLERAVASSVKEIVKLCYMGDGASWFLLSLLLVKLMFEILNRYMPEDIIFIVFSVLFWLFILNLGTITGYCSWGIFYFIGYLISRYRVDKIRGAEAPCICFVH